MAFKRVKYQFECAYCDPEVEKYVSVTEQAMEKHYLVVHNVDISGQIFEKLPWEERLKIEQVCKKWQHVEKGLSWSNYTSFKSYKYDHWPVAKLMQLKPFFERCGPYLRHFTFCYYSYFMEPTHTALTFLRMAPNVQHLSLRGLTANCEVLKELAQLLPHLKSLDLTVTIQINEDESVYSEGLIEWFQVMTCLEYLHLSTLSNMLFLYKPFVQFPSTLKYLYLEEVSSVDKIISWVAKGCKDLKGLRISYSINHYCIKEDVFQAISQMKSLTYLSVNVGLSLSGRHVLSDIGYIFEALTELRAFEINLTMDEQLITAIAQHCNKLEHLHISVYRASYDSVLRLATLPNLCSLSFNGTGYSKEQTVTFVNRLIVMGNLQYIKLDTSKEALNPKILFEMLRRCKKIRSIGLNFGRIHSGLYSQICRVVDEIDARDKQHGEFLHETHPIVEVQYNKRKNRNITEPYKWLRFKEYVSASVVCEKWKYGSLSAGKPF